MSKLVLCIFLVGYFLASSSVAQDIRHEAARDYLKLVEGNCKRDVANFKCNMTIQNLSKTQDIKDVTFLLDYADPSGTLLGSDQTTVYEIIPANKKITVQVEGMPHPQAKTAHVSIFNAKWK